MPRHYHVLYAYATSSYYTASSVPAGQILCRKLHAGYAMTVKVSATGDGKASSHVTMNTHTAYYPLSLL
eukprot:COSAG01_NODE_41435_length_451_cov_2.130682_2_plen_68_part_01